MSEETIAIVTGSHEEAKEVRLDRLRRVLGDVSFEAGIGNGGLTDLEIANELKAYAEQLTRREEVKEG